jgi:acyl carrier protein
VGLDIVELFMAVEKEFDVAIPDRVAEELLRLCDLHAFLVAALGQDGRAVDPAEVWGRLKRVAVRLCGFREDEVVPDAHLVFDLGLD